MYSDGFADQFGGPKGKKLMNKKFKEILASICNLPPEEQINKLDQIFNDWKGELDQVDDVLIIGFRF